MHQNEKAFQKILNLQILLFHGDVQFLSELCLALVFNNFQQPYISQNIYILAVRPFDGL